MLAMLFLLAMYDNLGIIASTGLQGRDNCAACDPDGVRTTIAPSIEIDNLGKFYESLLASVKGVQFSQRNLLREDTIVQRRAQPTPICCRFLSNGVQ
jgi:hypothetical protein